MKHVTASVAVLMAAGSALAGSISANGSVSLYGNSYAITSWNIATDSASTAASPAFGAEAMTFFNGVLYVGHDHDADRGRGQLVTFNPGATGNLASPTRIQFGNGPAGLWGPEGLTVNDSGAGFGSFASGSSVRLTGIDTRGSDFFGVFNTGAPGSALTPTAGPLSSFVALDDITFVGSRNQFAGVAENGGDSSVLRYFDHDATTMTITTFSVPVIDGAKGITTVSAAFAQLLTGQAASTAQALLVVSEFDGLAVYNTDGSLIGTAESLSSYLPVVELESVAVDEVNNLLFLGDETGTAVHVVQIPAPGALAFVGIAALAGARRRRA